MMVVSGHVTNGHLNPNQSFDALKDFIPVSLLASSPLLIFAHPSFPANDIKSMLALAKEKPATIAYSSPGVGSIQQLSMELLAYLAGVKLVHVPYRSGALALNDTLAGHVPLSVLSVLQALPHLQAKTIKPLAVTSAKATDILPDVPALAEAGQAYRGFLPETCVAWEEATKPAEMAGIRVVHLRIGLVLTAAGGVLAADALEFDLPLRVQTRREHLDHRRHAHVHRRREPEGLARRHEGREV